MLLKTSSFLGNDHDAINSIQSKSNRDILISVVIFQDCLATLSWKKQSVRMLLLMSISELQKHIPMTVMLI